MQPGSSLDLAPSSDQEPGSSAPGSTSPTSTGSPTPDSEPGFSALAPTSPTLLRRHSRSQSGIIKKKEYTDGTVRYDKVKRAFLSHIGEPTCLHDALAHKDWKEAMDHEYDALMKNKTWHLVPPR